MRPPRTRPTRRGFCAAAGVALLAPSLPPHGGPDADAKTAHEWPQYQGGPGHAGLSPDGSVRPPFKLAWSYRLDGDASGDAGGGAVVGGGRVYVSVLNTRSLLALDADTGRLLWEYADSYPGYRDVPSYSDGRLILWERSRKPRVLALTAATGKPAWEYPLEDSKHIPVLARGGLPVGGGRVFGVEGGGGPAAFALDEKTGKEVWRAGLGKGGGSDVTPPALGGKTLFVAVRVADGHRTGDRGALVALDAGTGKEVWRRADVIPSGRTLYTDGEVLACTLLADKQLRFHLLDAGTGKTLWALPDGFGAFNPPGATITKDHVLVKPYGGRFLILDRETGKQQAAFDNKCSSGCCTPVVAGGHAFLGTGIFAIGDRENLTSFKLTDAPRESGHGTSLHAVDLKTGKSVWFFGTGNTVCGDPAIAYGRLYFSSRDGRVYCLAPAGRGEPTAPGAKDAAPNAPPERVAALVAPERADRPPEEKAWPMAGGGPERAGLPGLGLKTPLKAAWQFDTGGRVLCGAALRDGRVFVGSDAGKLFALDARGGKPAWDFAAGAAVRCTPAVAGGLVYCGSDGGTFHALDAATGKEKWAFACGGPVQSSPAVAGGAVIFGAHDHHVYALDRDTGKKLWAARLRDYCVQAPVAVHGGQVFAAQWQDWVWALDLATGKEQWRAFIPVSIEAVAFHKGKVYARSPYYLVEIDPATGKRVRIGTVSYGYGGLAFLGDRLIQSGIRGQYGTAGATATDLAQEGKEMRTKVPTLEGTLMLTARNFPGSMDLASMVSPLVLGDLVCFAGLNGKLSVTDAGGKSLWSASLGGKCHSPPAAADGLLVVGCDDGRVYAYRGE